MNIKNTKTKSFLSAVGILLLSNNVSADWFPLDISNKEKDGSISKVQYIPQLKAEKRWSLCVSLPHMKDSLFLAANYGTVEEAKRQGVNLQVMDAGGYEHLSNQISQVENCVAGGADAVIIASISQDGLKNLVADLKSKNIPVIDAFNGIASDDVSARILTIPRDEGARAGEYLAKLYPAGGEKIRVGWFPGPAGTGFVEAFNEGFKEAIQESSVEIIETKYGDTGKEVQSRLIEDMLQTHKDIDYIVGTAVTAEAAIPVLRARGQSDKIKVLSVYMTPGVYQGVKRKAIAASGMAPAVLAGRIAVDQAIRLVEGKELYSDVGIFGKVYTTKDINELVTDTVLAPNGFKPVFRVTE